MMVTSTEASSDDEIQENVQQQMLLQLQCMNQRLEEVEQCVTGVEQHKGSKDSLKLSKSLCSGKDSVCHKSRVSSSLDESDVPDMSYLKTSKSIQRQVDQMLVQLNQCAQVQGKCSQKVKSKPGGVEVLVEKKVLWSHDVILGGNTKQRVSYDQFTQGFVKNVLGESNNTTRENMPIHLDDFMEDASDFSWMNAKAAHAGILCKIERGLLDWNDTNRLDRLRWAHAQKHTSQD